MSEDKKRLVPQHNLFDTHEHHDQHLCYLVSHRMMNRVAQFSLDARYICHICGRAAAKPENLCEPIEI